MIGSTHLSSSSSMISHSGRIQISSATHSLLLAGSTPASSSSAAASAAVSSSLTDVSISPVTDAWQPTGGLEVKGKGVMETYLWLQVGSVVGSNDL